MPKKGGGLGLFADLRGGGAWQERGGGGGVFLMGGWDPNAHYELLFWDPDLIYLENASRPMINNKEHT